jgi:hypothetical protein
MNLSNDSSALPDGSSHPFRGSSPNISNRKDARHAGLERERRSASVIGRERTPCCDKAASICVDAPIEPSGVRICADKEEEMVHRASVFRPGRTVAKDGARQAAALTTSETDAALGSKRAAGSLPSSGTVFSSSPAAILATLMALPITSAGRF